MASLRALSPSGLAAADSVALRGTASPAPCAASHAPRLPARHSVRIVAMAEKKKVISNLSDWKKEFIGYGLFVEDSEPKPVNLIKSLEEKKLLSSVEQAGLLSFLENNLGLTLSKIEQLKLLSTAEKLGALSFLEGAAVRGPGFFSTVSLVTLVAAVLVPIVTPDSSVALEVAQLSVAALLALTSVASFATSVALSILLD